VELNKAAADGVDFLAQDHRWNHQSVLLWYLGEDLHDWS